MWLPATVSQIGEDINIEGFNFFQLHMCVYNIGDYSKPQFSNVYLKSDYFLLNPEWYAWYAYSSRLY